MLMRLKIYRVMAVLFLGILPALVSAEDADWAVLKDVEKLPWKKR
jgi:hypothetical protein